MRKAALSYGFYEVFQTMGEVLHKELLNPTNNYPLEVQQQLAHVITCLAMNEYKDFRKDIQPYVAQAPAAQNYMRKLSK